MQNSATLVVTVSDTGCGNYLISIPPESKLTKKSTLIVQRRRRVILVAHSRKAMGMRYQINLTMFHLNSHWLAADGLQE